MFEADEQEKSLELTNSFYAAYERAKNFSDVPTYKQEQTDTVRAADDSLVHMNQLLTDNKQKEYLERCRTVINDFGCIPVYVLKQIALIHKKEDIAEQYKQLQILLPVNYIDRLIAKNNSIGNEPEQILLAEQMQ